MTTNTELSMYARYWLAALVLCMSAGCSAHTAYKSARPIGAGETRYMVAPQIHTAGARDGTPVPYPELGMTIRRGVTSKVDIGGAVAVLPLGEFLSSLSLEGSAQRHLYRSVNGRVDIAVGGGLGYRVIGTKGAVTESVYASVPLILGVHLGKHELIISPYAAWQRWYSEGTRPVDIPSLGTSIGFFWQVSKRIALLPEVSFANTPVRANSQDDNVLGHVGIAVVWGKK